MHTDVAAGGRHGSAAVALHAAAHYQRVASELLLALQQPLTAEDIGITSLSDDRACWTFDKARKSSRKRVAQPVGSIHSTGYVENMLTEEQKDRDKAQLLINKKRKLEALYAKCNPVCTCGGDPCAAAGLQMCDICSKIQKSLCKKQKCVQARAASAQAQASE